MDTTELELEIGDAGTPGEYLVRVLRSAGGGEPSGQLHLDVDDLIERRSQLESTILASAVRSRRGRVPASEAPLRHVGRVLFDAVFQGPIGSTYRASMAVARERGSRLRIVLRLTASELSVLPWEALFDPELESYVCRREPLVRHIPASHTPAPLAVEPPLRILGLVASPRGLAALDVDAERRHLDDALAGPVAAGTAEVTWLTDASWSAVHGALLSGSWHILHVVGHGDYDVEADEGRIALVGETGLADWVEASRLVDLLDEASPTPRLVVLNSCSSAEGGVEDVFSGTAASLVRSGINAVAAMQFTVSDGAALAFARGFYGALAAGRRVDEAVRSGRIAILGAPRSLEWVTPVLYLRGNAGRLFTIAPPVRSEPTAATVPPVAVATAYDLPSDLPGDVPGDLPDGVPGDVPGDLAADVATAVPADGPSTEPVAGSPTSAVSADPEAVTRGADAALPPAALGPTPTSPPPPRVAGVPPWPPPPNARGSPQIHDSPPNATAALPGRPPDPAVRQPAGPGRGHDGSALPASGGPSSSHLAAELISRTKQEVVIDVSAGSEHHRLCFRTGAADRLVVDDELVGWSLVDFAPEHAFNLTIGGRQVPCRFATRIGRWDARIKQITLLADGREILRDPA